MTVPNYVNEDWIRAKVRNLRRNLQFDHKIRSEDGTKVDACYLEEEMVAMWRRHHNAPAELVALDGFGSGGSESNGRSYRQDGAPASRTETMAVNLTDPDYKAEYDEFDALFAKTVDKLDQGDRAIGYVKQLTDQHKRRKKPDPVFGQTVAMCPTVGGAVDDDGNVPAPVPCGEIAEPGRRLCRGCRRRLQVLNEKREAQGLDRLKDLPKHEADALFAERTKRRQYEHEAEAS